MAMTMKYRILLIIIFCMSAQCVIAQPIPFCQKGKWGFASNEGIITVPCIYEEVNFYGNDSLSKVKKAGKYGYINMKGTVVVPFQFEKAFRIYEVFHEEYSMGLTTIHEIHLNSNFDFNDIGNNRYIVSKNRKFGIIRLTGGKPGELVPFQFSAIQFDPAKKVFHCQEGKTTKYFDMEGHPVNGEKVSTIKEPVYYTVGEPEPNMPMKISKNGKLGMMVRNWSNSSQFDTIVPALYDEILPKDFGNFFSPAYTLFGVRLGNKWGFTNGTGKILLPIEYDSINYSWSGMRHWLPSQYLFVARKNGKWGILGKKDDQDSTKIFTYLPFEYQAISGMYAYRIVQKDNRWRIYDSEKNFFISQKTYASVDRYEHNSVNGFYLFQVKNKQGQTVFVGENGVEFFTD